MQPPEHPIDVQFESRVAHLWKAILLSDRSSNFGGTIGIVIDRPHGFDRLPQPGLVGSRYRPGGFLLLAQNPGNDRHGKGTSEPDMRQYAMFDRLQSAPDGEPTVIAARELMSVLALRVMPTWPIVVKVVQPLLNALGLELNDIAYTNLVKFRTLDSGFKGSIYTASWPMTLQQIELLRPSSIICLGSKTYTELVKLYPKHKNIFRISRGIGDAYLPSAGKADIIHIAEKLRFGDAMPDGVGAPSKNQGFLTTCALQLFDSIT